VKGPEFRQPWTRTHCPHSIHVERRIEGKRKVVPLLIQALRREDVLRECRYRSTHLNLGASWRWMVSFTPLPLLTGVWGWVGPATGLLTRWRGEKSYHCPFREFNSGRPTRSLATMLTELSCKLWCLNTPNKPSLLLININNMKLYINRKR
jgi:hypothetical protein